MRVCIYASKVDECLLGVCLWCGTPLSFRGRLLRVLLGLNVAALAEQHESVFIYFNLLSDGGDKSQSQKDKHLLGDPRC